MKDKEDPGTREIWGEDAPAWHAHLTAADARELRQAEAAQDAARAALSEATRARRRVVRRCEWRLAAARA